MNPTIIEGIFKNCKDVKAFSQALMAIGCDYTIANQVYSLCKSGNYQTASQMVVVNTHL